jgi:hypothetical protein
MVSLVGKKGNLGALNKAIQGKNPNLSVFNKAFKAALGSQSSKFGVYLELARQGGTEALTGGIEEWIQTAMELAFTETAYKLAGSPDKELKISDEGVTTLEEIKSLLPRNPNGSVDTGAILGMMNEAFVAGMFLEGAIGGSMAVRGVKTRKAMAERIGSIKNMLNNEAVMSKEGLVRNKEGWGLAYNELSSEHKDFIARRILVELIAKEEAFEKKHNKQWTLKQRAKAVKFAKENAVSLLQNNPVRALFVGNANANLESVKDGEIAIVSIGGKKIPIVKSSELDSGAKLIANPDGSTHFGVSDETWAELERLGLSKQFIAINMYQGSTIAHEVLHHVIRNLEGAELDSALDLFNNENLDLTAREGEQAVQEKAAGEMEQYLINRANQPVGNAFKDAFYRIQIALKGKNASAQAKKSVIFQQTAKAIGTGSAIDFSHLQGEDRVRTAQEKAGAAFDRSMGIIRGIGHKAAQGIARATAEPSTAKKPSLEDEVITPETPSPMGIGETYEEQLYPLGQEKTVAIDEYENLNPSREITIQTVEGSETMSVSDAIYRLDELNDPEYYEGLPIEESSVAQEEVKAIQKELNKLLLSDLSQAKREAIRPFLDEAIEQEFPK